jgi:hypothetical protein
MHLISLLSRQNALKMRFGHLTLVFMGPISTCIDATPLLGPGARDVGKGKEPAGDLSNLQGSPWKVECDSGIPIHHGFLDSAKPEPNGVAVPITRAVRDAEQKGVSGREYHRRRRS